MSIVQQQECIVAAFHTLHAWSNSKIFFLRFSTSDDMFILYAALSSGPDCFVLSSDHFSDHKHYLAREDGGNWQSFARWQRLRQRPRIDYEEIPDEQYMTAMPLPVHLSTQCNGGHWHVPVSSDNMSRASARLANQGQWLCLPIGTWCITTESWISAVFHKTIYRHWMTFSLNWNSTALCAT